MAADPSVALAAMGDVLGGGAQVPPPPMGEPIICGNCGTPIDPISGQPVGDASAAAGAPGGMPPLPPPPM